MIALNLGFRNDFSIAFSLRVLEADCPEARKLIIKQMKTVLIFLMVPACMAVFCTLYWIVEKRMNTWRRKIAQKIILRKHAVS